MRVKSIDELPPAIRQQLRGQTGAPAKRLTEVDQKPKRAKYRNTKVESYGITFDSAWEAQRYEELLRLERLSIIRDLQVHQSFGLHVQSPSGELVRICGWEGDFTYYRSERFVVEDTKSKPTRTKEAYVIKKKHFQVEYGVKVIEVERNGPRLLAEE